MLPRSGSRGIASIATSTELLIDFQDCGRRAQRDKRVARLLSMWRFLFSSSVLYIIHCLLKQAIVDYILQLTHSRSIASSPSNPNLSLSRTSNAPDPLLDIFRPSATLPSPSQSLNPHKHLLSPESSPERDHKHIKPSEPQTKQVNSNNSTMSSEEDYDDLVYDDDEGFDHDGMDPGKSLTTMDVT